MKIAIIGFTEYENLGDQFIGKTVEYLVKQYGAVETEVIDFQIDRNKREVAFALRLLHKISRMMKFDKLSDRLCIKKYQSYYKKTIFKSLLNVDGLIFACGSFKYGTQDLWAQYSAIIEYANNHSIPVMFDAMNVQKYNDSDFRCEYLKKHLNYPCVKYFTSRDGEAGVERLKTDYITDGKMKIYPAADPAFWIPETYHIRNRGGHTVGVNVITPDQFLAYGGTLKPEIVKNAYLEFLQILTKNGFEWQLFTNGLAADNEFAKELAQCCDVKGDDVICPTSDVELANLEANYMVVFGARLHSMICAYSFGVPVAGFIWDEKITHFAEMAKLDGLFLKEYEITGKAMYEVLMKALQRKEDIKNREYWKNTTQKTIGDFLDTLK